MIPKFSLNENVSKLKNIKRFCEDRVFEKVVMPAFLSRREQKKKVNLRKTLWCDEYFGWTLREVFTNINF